ncbi:MAG: hypothetical protein KFB96_05345 [Thiocapsa sp.]|uniref:hypothetical protein n=1 Tax=Thiocapsa sp. TaxID=2024551 RepID=UPI001BD028C3|nr:hypothetical protein [Thiocapsa sp.]QVL49907.1 MAG: hypothetical protein KFB96_05345 [Thiocapsa sp.]
MSKFTQPSRSVRDIKTLAGMADDVRAPHKLYMRLFALETERHRRLQERASAMLRVDTIDARCAEIGAEMEQLLQILGVEAVAPGDLPGNARAGSGRGSTPPSAQARGKRIGVGRQGSSGATSVGETVKIRY